MNNPNEKRLNELKLLYIDFLEMDQISKQFNNYIQRIKNLDQIIFGNISETFRSTNQTDNLIPIPCSIKQVTNKIRKTPLDQWPMINPSLQCYRLDKQPLLLMNCNYINTNDCIVKLIEQILPVMIDIDKDIDRVHYALQLIMPKLRDGEYVAIDLLEQLMDKIESFQCEIQTGNVFFFFVLFLENNFHYFFIRTKKKNLISYSFLYSIYIYVYNQHMNG